MVKNNIADSLLMPSFAIDTVVDEKGNEIVGIKRMYDIALALNDSLMQWGAPGVGKSQAVQQWNAEKVREYKARIAAGEKIKPWNPDVCDVRLSMKEPVDMVGIPVLSKDENGKVATVWATPSVWPQGNEYSGGVIHLDEMNQGQAAILNAAFQLIQDRALGEYKVPDGYIIIGSSNTSAYNNTVTEFSIPLSNRFSHFNIKPDFNSWFQYRMDNGGNPEIMTFLKTQGQDVFFDKMGMEARVGKMADAMFTDIVVTPRSWEVIEKLVSLPNGTKETGGFTMDEKQRYATGRLGLALANKVFTFLKDASKYQDWREILEKGKDFRSEENEQFWSVQINCIQAISNQIDDTKCREYVLNFVEATRHLKSIPGKVVNIAQLVRLPRLKNKIKVFNPLIDAKDLIEYCNLANK
jgi:MoxR-like ATPase